MAGSAPAGPRWTPWALWPAAAAAAIAVALPLLDGRAPAMADTASDVAQVLLYAVASVAALRAARRLEGPLRTGWRFLAAAGALAVLASLVFVALAASGRVVEIEANQAVPLLVVVNGLAFLGLLLLSPPDLARGSRARVGLDGLIAGGSLLFLVLAWADSDVGFADGGIEAVDLLYPAIDAAGLTIAVLVLAHARGSIPPWYWALAGAWLVVFVADAAFATGGIPGWVAEAGLLLFLGLVATGAGLARPWPQRAAKQETLAFQAGIYMPFIVALLASGYDYLENGGLSTGLFFLLLTLIGLVVVRTVMLLSENRDLYANFEATDAFKTQLLRFISHEIANPLSPLKMQTSLLRQGVAKDLDRAWNAVDRSIGRLESLSRDVRLMALAETRRIVQELKVSDLVPRIASAVQAHQAVAQQRGVHLRADLPAYPLAVPIDGERFDQVIDNLLSNALKFTPAGGIIDVRLFRSPGGVAAIEVKDSGAGMTPEQQQTLFTAFGRPQGATQPGLGLGLYLCKAIVDGHDGRITASSQGAGQGSRFRVELPLGRVTARPRGGQRPAYAVHEHGGGPDVPAGRPPDLPL